MNAYKYFIRFVNSVNFVQMYHEDWYEASNKENAAKQAVAYASWVEQRSPGYKATEIRLIDAVEV